MKQHHKKLIELFEIWRENSSDIDFLPSFLSSEFEADEFISYIHDQKGGPQDLKEFFSAFVASVNPDEDFFRKLAELADAIDREARKRYNDGFGQEASELLHCSMFLKYLYRQNIRDFRYVERVNFELATVCNLKCKYCSFHSGKRQKYIKEETFKAVLEELAVKVKNLKRLALYMSGESLMHPNFIKLLEIVRDVKDRYPNFKPLTYLHTNGMLWTPKMNDKILAANALDLVIWSIDGYDKESFEKMRPGAVFERVMANYRNFVRSKPASVSAGINNIIEHNALYETRSPEMQEAFAMCDELRVIEPKELNEAAPAETDVKWFGKCDSFCEYLFHTVVVTTAGQMSLCCVDYNSVNAFGNIEENGFEAVYFSSEHMKLLEHMAEGKRNHIKGCKKCTLVTAAWSTELAGSQKINHVRAMVNKFLQISKNGRIAVFGVGGHTAWLERVLNNTQKNSIAVLLDDNPEEKPNYFGLKAMKAELFTPDEIDGIIISSERNYNEMYKRCRELYGDSVKLINLYEGLPSVISENGR